MATRRIRTARTKPDPTYCHGDIGLMHNGLFELLTGIYILYIITLETGVPHTPAPKISKFYITRHNSFR